MDFNQSHSSIHLEEGCIRAYIKVMAVTLSVSGLITVSIPNLSCIAKIK